MTKTFMEEEPSRMQSPLAGQFGDVRLQEALGKRHVRQFREHLIRRDRADGMREIGDVR
jgi:hypothetical protein